jgi:selenium-dependent xanthine dehydrogenase
MAVSFRVNGVEHTVEPKPGESLLETLRERLNITSPKDGCSPQGQCGCCTVIVDGQARVSCATPCDKFAGKNIVTLEGIAPERRRILGEAFARTGGLQCGFCIPGIVARAENLLTKTPNPTRDEIAKSLDIHLCRCTGYVKIIDAIELAGRAMRGEALPEVDPSGKVGTRHVRFEGPETALGVRPFIDDMKFDGMLHGAVKFSDHARAKVLSIDVSEAAAMPGVKGVYTWRDVPGERYYGLLYNDWPGLIAEGEETHCVGDQIALVVAEDRITARAAAEKVKVVYEVLTPVVTPEDALKPDAPKIGPKGNLLSKSKILRGDADAALASSKHVVSGHWVTQRIEHMFLEPESSIGIPEGEGIRLYSQGQGIFDDRRQIARFLGLTEENVHVTLVSNGGAFGGKEDMSIQAQAALLAFKTKRPVKITISREESINLHPKRHPIKMHYTVGCDENGKITAVKARMIGDSGAYASVGGKVLERASGHACSAYDVPNVDVEALAVYTNNPPCGAMRGFGANQAAFAMEGALDMLAEKAGLDRWEIRWRNALEVGSTFSSGQVLKHSVGLKKTLLAVKDAFYNNKYVGIACGIKNCGIGNGVPEWGKARLVIESTDRITLYNGYTEMGQGLLTILAQIVCEETNLSPEIIFPKVDTTYALGCGQTTGSRATIFSGNAVKVAAKKLAEDLKAGHTLAELIGKEYPGEYLCDFTHPLGAPVADPITHLTFGFATQLLILDDQGKMKKFIAAHDVGKALNPTLCEGQIEGSIHMGLGYALTEELRCRDGRPENTALRAIGVLRAKDMPEMEVILVEDHEPNGPYGAKGVGEIGLVPTAGAVAGALAAFDGVRRMSLPMVESPAAKATSVASSVLKNRKEGWS